MTGIESFHPNQERAADPLTNDSGILPQSYSSQDDDQVRQTYSPTARVTKMKETRASGHLAAIKADLISHWLENH